jgi:hypothetical protein
MNYELLVHMAKVQGKQPNVADPPCCRTVTMMHFWLLIYFIKHHSILIAISHTWVQLVQIKNHLNV